MSGIEEIKTRESFIALTIEARVDFIGEQLTQEVYRGVSLTSIMHNILERVEALEARYSIGNKGITFELRNELTYLHNEVNEIKKLLGMLGDVPKVKRQSKY